VGSNIISCSATTLQTQPTTGFVAVTGLIGAGVEGQGSAQTIPVIDVLTVASGDSIILQCNSEDLGAQYTSNPMWATLIAEQVMSVNGQLPGGQ
jgi:hypothetical protein